MKPLLIAALGRPIPGTPSGWADHEVEVRHTPALPTARSLDADRPTVILLDRTLLASVGGDRARLDELCALASLIGIGNAGEREPPDELRLDLLTSYVAGDAPPRVFGAALGGAFRHAAALVAARRSRDVAHERSRELAELTAIGLALSTERDLGTLLDLILTQARRITSSDAGSVYLVERDEAGVPQRLRFAMAQNHSLPTLPFSSFTVPFDHTSLAGYAAATGEPLVIADVYQIPAGLSYRQNRDFDDAFGYRTKSMLVFPMKTHRDEIVGVLQLINRTRSPGVRLLSDALIEREVVTYDDHCVELTSALASQAGVAIENGRLYADIERLFEGFVTAAVTAIESRDPATSGHSGRVSTMTVGLAEAIDRAGDGPYRHVTFSHAQLRELRYAGLLHDFGKVGVREQVLVKEKKLYPQDLELIRHRFAYLLQRVDLEFERDRAEWLLLRKGTAGYEEAIAALDDKRRRRQDELRCYLDAVVRANEPSVLPETSFDALHRIRDRTYVDFNGRVRPLLEEHELQYLMIPQGNLDDAERREIESHVTHTFRFLEQIPWTRELRAIPQIAYGHHEKLNGRGYPNALGGAAIPVQTRMMTIADIYDALTATDRPYKRAVSRVEALDILHTEAREGMVDTALLDAFVQARVFELGQRDASED